MSDMLQTLLAPPGIEDELFPHTSRYRGVRVVTYRPPGGMEIAYLRRRFVPPPEYFVTVQEHTIVQGDRLDNLAHQYLGDPELYWRLCDANGAVRPTELTDTIGNALRITLPEGIPGDSNA